MGWFRMAPVVYCVIGGLAAIVAAFLFFADRDAEAAKAKALAGKPPAAVEVDKFDLARNVGPAGEATILGQIDTSKLIDVRQTEDGRETRRWLVAPIHSVTATAPAPMALGAIVQDGAISDEQLSKLVVGDGPFGPIMRLNGTVGSTDGTSDALAEAAKGGIVLGANPVIVDPFENGRAVALAPSSGGREGAGFVLVLGLIVIGYGLARWAFIARQNRRYEQATAAR